VDLAAGMTAPAQVIDLQTDLYQAMKRPTPAMTRLFDNLISTRDQHITELSQGHGRDLAGVPLQSLAMIAAWGSLTWPASTGREMAALIGGSLYDARTFQVTADITPAVSGMFRASADRNTTIREADLPCPAGFAYLDEPVPLTDAGGLLIANRALSWGVQVLDIGAKPERGVRITSWCGPDQTAPFHRPGEPAPGGVAPAYSVFVPFGSPYVRSGVTPAHLPPQITLFGDDMIRWAHCLWLFTETPFTAADRRDPDRSTRRRAERAGRPAGPVTVITLRQSERRGQPGRRDADWTCRWVVQGHPRHLDDYSAGFEHHDAKVRRKNSPCLVCGSRTTHIGAYIKGPEGLPLKVTADTVYRVAR
jgi:hypothetical protein